MKRFVIASVLAACGDPELSIDDRPAPEEPSVHVVAVEHVEPPPHGAYDRVELGGSARVVHGLATTGSAIALVDDGGAAVTVDTGGALRLWPALDGTREPVVVPARRAAKVAVGRDGAGFAIAALDSLGQLEVVHVTAGGAEDGRVAIDGPRPFVAVHALGDRVLALRDDHVIAVFDARGELAGEVAARPGERIARLAVRGSRALAIVERGNVVRGRWIDATGDVTWGARTARLAIDPATDVALSPSGKRLAAVAVIETPVTSSVGQQLPPMVTQQLVIVALATGEVVETLTSPDDDPTLAPLGFFGDDATVAMRAQSALHVWAAGVDSRIGDRLEPAAAAGRHVVSTFGLVLELATADSKQYLGYRHPNVSDVVPRAHDLLATDGQEVFEIEPSLRGARELELHKEAHGLTGNAALTLLDDHHVLAANREDKYVLDLDHLDATPVKVAIPGTVSSYTRGAHVLALYRSSGYAFVAFDPATGRFGEPLVVTHDMTQANAFVRDPSVDGVVAVVAVGKADHRLVDLIEVVRTKDGVERGVTRTIEVPHGLWEDFAQVQKAAHADVRGPEPSPDGTLATATANARFELRDAAGHARWTKPVFYATWTSDSRLLAFGGGLAYVDLATGEFAERQCGWSFGLFDQPPGSWGSGSLCDAP